MNIVVFGTGDIYRRNKKYVDARDKIIAFLDNNRMVQGTWLDGAEIFDPTSISILKYDKIIIMSSYSLEMKEQLLRIGCSDEDILHYTEYIGHLKKGQLMTFTGKGEKKKALIITSSLGYHGGSITAVYMAMELKRRGYETTVAAPEGDTCFIEEFQEQGLNFLLYPNLRYADWSELFWIRQFQKVVVNTYPMILCALEISRYQKCILWLHESDIVYSDMIFWKEKILGRIGSAALDIYAVSNVAKQNFERNIMKCTIGILPYGIPDAETNHVKAEKKDGRLRFAVIGTIHPIKRQIFFLDAVGLLEQPERTRCEFLIIGDAGNEQDYIRNVAEKAKEFSNARIINRLTRKELRQAYEDIDVLVVSAEAETMSLVATEAMMHEKVCILCDVAGMAEFIEHGRNGLLYQTDRVDSLAEQMKFCIHHSDRLGEIGKCARGTYEKYFTMEQFGERLKRIL